CLYVGLDSLSPFFFSSRLPPPPIAPLFPYTTLFRSLRGGLLEAVHRLAVAVVRDPQLRLEEHLGAVDVGGAQGLPHLSEVFLETDRKSTRLNSSHVSISYAVFCLKKKNTRTSTSSIT